MRRSPLIRRTPLPRPRKPMKRTALSRRPSQKRRKRLEAWKVVTREAIRRVKGVCPVKGERCTRRATVGHHIRLKSQGGLDVLGNCLPCCRNCHIETVHGNPTWARRMGYIVTNKKGISRGESRTPSGQVG